MPRTKLHDEISDYMYNFEDPDYYDDPTEIIRIIEQNPNLINIQDDDGRTALHCATRQVFPKKAKALLDLGARADIEDNYGHSSIYYETMQLRSGLGLIVEMFLQVNIGINKRYDKEKNTLLHIASANGNVELVRFFLSKGADVKIKNNQGKTPADMVREAAEKVETLPKALILSESQERIQYAERAAGVLKILEPFGPELLSQSASSFWNNKRLLAGGVVVGLTAVAVTAVAVASDMIDVPECKIS